MKAFHFNFRGYGYNLINNFKYFYGYDYLSIAANSYIKSTELLIMSFIKKPCQFFGKFCKCGRPYFESVDWISTLNIPVML
jgi:NTE family protein